MELPARSRTQSLALEELKVDGEKPSIRVVPPKQDIGPWMGIRCLFLLEESPSDCPIEERIREKGVEKWQRIRNLLRKSLLWRRILPSGIQM